MSYDTVGEDSSGNGGADRGQAAGKSLFDWISAAAKEVAVCEMTHCPIRKSFLGFEIMGEATPSIEKREPRYSSGHSAPASIQARRMPISRSGSW